MFELATPTDIKVIEVEILSQKNRQPDEDPGVKMHLQSLLSNDMLSAFDGALKGMLFDPPPPRSPDVQPELDGIPPASDRPILSGIGRHIKRFRWEDELTGYRFEVDHGLGGASNIVIDECTLSNFKFQPQEPGSVLVDWWLESPNVSVSRWGHVAKMKSTKVLGTLIAPEPAQQTFDDGKPENWPFRRAAVDQVETQKKDATEAFLAAHTGGAE